MDPEFPEHVQEEVHGPMNIPSRMHAVLIWPTDRLSAILHGIPALRRFDAWANEKECEWRRRRNAALVVSLREAGLHDAANRLSE